jgi:hypothetical protein
LSRINLQAENKKKKGKKRRKKATQVHITIISLTRENQNHLYKKIKLEARLPTTNTALPTTANGISTTKHRLHDIGNIGPHSKSVQTQAQQLFTPSSLSQSDMEKRSLSNILTSQGFFI